METPFIFKFLTAVISICFIILAVCFFIEVGTSKQLKQERDIATIKLKAIQDSLATSVSKNYP